MAGVPICAWPIPVVRCVNADGASPLSMLLPVPLSSTAPLGKNPVLMAVSVSAAARSAMDVSTVWTSQTSRTVSFEKAYKIF